MGFFKGFFLFLLGGDGGGGGGFNLPPLFPPSCVKICKGVHPVFENEALTSTCAVTDLRSKGTKMLSCCDKDAVLL